MVGVATHSIAPATSFPCCSRESKGGRELGTTRFFFAVNMSTLKIKRFHLLGYSYLCWQYCALRMPPGKYSCYTGQMYSMVCRVQYCTDKYFVVILCKHWCLLCPFLLQRKCDLKHPPGDEIYRNGSLSMFEVCHQIDAFVDANVC